MASIDHVFGGQRFLLIAIDVGNCSRRSPRGFSPSGFRIRAGEDLLVAVDILDDSDYPRRPGRSRCRSPASRAAPFDPGTPAPARSPDSRIRSLTLALDSLPLAGGGPGWGSEAQPHHPSIPPPATPYLDGPFTTPCILSPQPSECRLTDCCAAGYRSP